MRKKRMYIFLWGELHRNKKKQLVIGSNLINVSNGVTRNARLMKE